MSPLSRMASLATRLGARVLAAGRVAIAVTGLEHIPAAGPVLLVAFGSRQMLVRYLERRVAELSRLLADRQELLAAGQG
jgi:hypothetical protein